MGNLFFLFSSDVISMFMLSDLNAILLYCIFEALKTG